MPVKKGYEYYRVQMTDYGIDILCKTKMDRLVDPAAYEELDKIFPDFSHNFAAKPWSRFVEFLRDEYRSKGIMVTLEPPPHVS